MLVGDYNYNHYYYNMTFTHFDNSHQIHILSCYGYQIMRKENEIYGEDYVTRKYKEYEMNREKLRNIVKTNSNRLKQQEKSYMKSRYC